MLRQQLDNKWTDSTSILIAFFIYFKILLLIRTAMGYIYLTQIYF